MIDKENAEKLIAVARRQRERLSYRIASKFDLSSASAFELLELSTLVNDCQKQMSGDVWTEEQRAQYRREHPELTEPPTENGLVEEFRKAYPDIVSLWSSKARPLLACVIDMQRPEFLSQLPALEQCGMGADGVCTHPNCPQSRDGEPGRTLRACPLT